MRVVLVVVGAFFALGLAAFGVVAAQRAAGPASLIVLAAHIISPGQSSGAALQPSQPVQARPAQAPVVQGALTTAVPAADAPAPEGPCATARSAPTVKETETPKSSIAPTKIVLFIPAPSLKIPDKKEAVGRCLTPSRPQRRCRQEQK